MYLHLAPPLGWLRLSFAEILASENYIPCAIVWRYLRERDNTFSRFSRTPTCDRRTDRRRDTWRQLIPALASVARAKKVPNVLQGSVATRLRCGGICNDGVVANVLLRRANNFKNLSAFVIHWQEYLTDGADNVQFILLHHVHRCTFTLQLPTN